MSETDFSILIADDNEMNRWLLAEQLESWSSDVTLASDGLEAWRYLQHTRYALVFLDVNMPGFTGQELVKKARADSANILSRIIAITAHVQSQQQHLLIADGFDECLIKPIMLSDLQRVIVQWRASKVDSNSQYYANALIEKVGNDRDLGRIFLEKLMLEVPEQIVDLQHALQAEAVDDAWAIAHKLHGSFSFYGFADFRSIAKRLECALLAKDSLDANRCFEQLVGKFDAFKELQIDMKRHLGN